MPVIVNILQLHVADGSERGEWCCFLNSEEEEQGYVGTGVHHLFGLFMSVFGIKTA